MAKSQLTKESIKETIKQYDRIKKNVKKVFDMIGTFCQELDRMFDDKETVHYWWNKVSDELKLGVFIDWDDLVGGGSYAYIQDDNTIVSIALSGKFVWADVTNYVAHQDETTAAAVPLEIVINPKILADSIKKYRMQAKNEQKTYDVAAEKVIGKIAGMFIDKYGKRLHKADGLLYKFMDIARSTEEQWGNYRICVSDVYVAKCSCGLDHLFVVYKDRDGHSGVYASRITN